MNHQDYLDSFLVLDKQSLSSRGKNAKATDKGLEGEQALLPILNRHADVLFQDVIIPGSRAGRANFVSEMDFVCIINGNLTLIEAKNWYGRMRKTEDKGRVSIACVNYDGKYHHSYRTNPKTAMGGFTKDFINYLGGRPKKSQIKRLIVFLREELIIDPEIDVSSSMIVCHLSDFEEKLLNETKNCPDNPCELPAILPSWDCYFDRRDKRWYKGMLLNEAIKTSTGQISCSSIHSLSFDEDNPAMATVRFRNGLEKVVELDPNEIATSRHISVARGEIGAFVLNECFHAIHGRDDLF